MKCFSVKRLPAGAKWTYEIKLEAFLTPFVALTPKPLLFRIVTDRNHFCSLREIFFASEDPTTTSGSSSDLPFQTLSSACYAANWARISAAYWSALSPARR